MPTSWYHVIPSILEFIERYRPRSILDVGVGFGKYGVLLREALEVPHGRYHKSQWRLKVEGIEVFRGYKNPLHEYCYDRIYYEEVTSILHKLPQYDFILLIDVLEHLEKDQGRKLIRELLDHCTQCVLISTPLYPSAQGGYLGNEYETHKSRWVITDFIDFDFSYKLIPIGSNAAQLISVFPSQGEHSRAPHVEPTLAHAQSLRLDTEPLTVGYFLPHRNLTGGMKALVAQMRWLQARGHRIVVFGKAEDGAAVMPAWSDFEPDVVVPLHPARPLLECVNSAPCDVVIAGWWEQLPELAELTVPVIYWEQGHEWLFGELNDLAHDAPARRWLSYCYKQPCHMASVSPTVAQILRVRYNRETFILPNGIDTDVYSPGKRPDDGTVLLVGNPSLRFKGFDVALRTLQKVWNAGYKFKVRWICQVKPEVKGVTFPIHFVVNPPQGELPRYIADADILLFTSWYEGFGMPPLEAMACGVPVVATECGGIQTYAKPGENALLADPGDVDSLAHAVIYLLNNKEAREYLGQKGRETALRFHFSKVIPILESYAYTVVRARNAAPNGT